MKTWYLIILMHGYATGAVHHVPFGDLKACETAIERISDSITQQNKSILRGTVMRCVRKTFREE